MFGSYFGKKEIVELMMDHSVAKKSYSEKSRNVIRRYGHLIFRLFGYPPSVSVRQRARVILKYLKPNKGERILDAGCGIGYYSFELATKFGCKVDGIDIDAEDIELADQIAQKMHISTAEFSIRDICELKFDDETFDKVILTEVLEHIRNDEKVLKELNRILKIGGYLILSTPYVTVVEEYDEQKLKVSQVEGGHVRNGYSFERLSKLLNDTGFDVVEHCFVNKKFTKDADFPLFLLMYPISMLDKFLNGTGETIIVKVQK